MDEAFLHFVWKFQKFQNHDLTSVNGESIQVFHPGLHNQDSGPDFSQARVKIGPIEWSGHVEIHIKSSDWDRHNHSSDQAYDNVILHVVWQQDSEITRKDKSIIATLELKGLINPDLLIRYKSYLLQPEEVLCHGHLEYIPDVIWHGQLDSMLTFRLEQKSERILQLAQDHLFDWEEVAYITLARNFGFALNGEAMERLATSLSLQIIRKHADKPVQIQALLFGQAGFLDSEQDSYQKELIREYGFLKKKYNLDGIHRAHWKFGKMRPPNFPSVRVIQLSGILSKSTKLFSTFSALNSLRELKRIFHLEFSDYWKTHYDFGKMLKKGTNEIGNKSVENLIINTVAPLLAAYSLHTGQGDMMTKAITFLEQLPPESNRFTKHFEKLGKSPSSAFDSQAQITLFKDFCTRKKCLNCAIGTAIFKK